MSEPSLEQQLREVFVEEAGEILADFEQALLLLESLPDDPELVDRLFRGAHTLKGNARILGLTRLEQLAHQLETALDALRRQERMATRELTDALLRSLDVLKALTAELHGGAPCDASAYDAAIFALTKQPVVATPVVVQAPPPAPRAAGDSEASSVRVSIEKLDRLINLTGEVVIAQSIITQLVEDLTPERLSVLREVVAQMDRHCRELQERMLGARLLPLRHVFARFHRLVRDLSASTGKSIRLELSGEDTELDKTVIEKIADPLTHLLRNAADHGVELPGQRAASGKPAQACIHLDAYQKGGHIFIEVRDDGRGIDRERVLAKAVERRMVARDAQLSDDEVFALIFQPGFSTAEQVSELSGRGVGMDVVKRNVEALKGTVTVLSEPGRGTTFRVKLPLTLAILDGLGLRVGDEVYLVPMVAVVESLQPRPEEVHTLPHAGEVIDLRGEYLPLIRLSQVFGLEPSRERGLVMVIDDGSQKLALQIDELLGQYQVVIKSLEANFRTVPGIAGATVLGDGRVALILDTANLASVALRRAREREVA
jgi:two-component system chemotaxis sensor kinase CheA